MSLISFIVAISENRVIGRRGQLPWRLPADLRRFKAITMGKPILMGRRTFESIGRPLPARKNLLVTTRADYRAPGCTVCHSIEEALATAGQAPEVLVIGGASLYRSLLPRAERIYLTLIHARCTGDTFFPELDPGAWQETERSDHAPDAENALPYSFLVLEPARRA
jgi:dihydrofolate reductase